MKSTIMFLVIILIISCKKNDINSREYYQVTDLSKKTTEKSVIRLTMEPLKLDSIESSMVGNFWIINDTLFFSDTYYNYVYRFEKNGAVIDRHIGKGKGPNEVLGFTHSIPFDNGYCFISVSNSLIYLFSKNWIKTKQLRIHWNVKSNYKKLLNNPDPKTIQPYELRINLPDLVQKWDRNHILVTISASHPKFNGYFNSALYYDYSRIFALIDLENGKIIDLLGRRSPVYLEKSNIPNFDHCNFTLNEKDLFVNFWPDPFIYVIDKASHLSKGKFGISGQDMKNDYPLTQKYEDAERNRRKDWLEYGHYSYLKDDPNRNLLFRGYTKGKGSSSDGLQIYKSYELIGDIEVPMGFKIIGSIGDNLYASIENGQELSSLNIFKIELKYEN